MESDDEQIAYKAAYRAMIVELSTKITNNELLNMKFLCKDFIPTKVRDSLILPLQLFEALEERHKLSATNLDFLRNLLGTACYKREDVIHIVDNFEQGDIQQINNLPRGNLPQLNERLQRAMDVDAHPIQESGLRDTFQVLEDNLGKEALHFLRRLGIDDIVLDRLRSDYPRDMKEVIHRALRHWEDSLRPNANVQKIVEALKKEHRNDIVSKIECIQ